MTRDDFYTLFVYIVSILTLMYVCPEVEVSYEAEGIVSTFQLRNKSITVLPQTAGHSFFVIQWTEIRFKYSPSYKNPLNIYAAHWQYVTGTYIVFQVVVNIFSSPVRNKNRSLM